MEVLGGMRAGTEVEYRVVYLARAASDVRGGGSVREIRGRRGDRVDEREQFGCKRDFPLHSCGENRGAGERHGGESRGKR